MIFQGLIFLKRILKMYQVTNQSNIRSSIHSEDLIFLYLSLAIKTNLIILKKKKKKKSLYVTIKKDGHVIVKVKKPYTIHSYFDIYNIYVSSDMVGVVGMAIWRGGVVGAPSCMLGKCNILIYCLSLFSTWCT